MSKKNIEKYIPKAMDALSETFDKGTFPSSYNGYISSFGASIIQSGLKPTLALFENKDSSTKEKKELLTNIILKIIDSNTKEESLLHYILQNQQNEHYLKQQILDISIAIKLSLRTFKKEN